MKTTAKELGLSIWQVKGLLDAGTLPTVDVNGRKYIPAADVYTFARGNTPEGSE